MAKLSYLDMTNRILRRISQATLSSGVSTSSGHAAIISNLINEAQLELYTETNWYSLYQARTFTIPRVSAATIAFNNANPDTITDSASGFGNFQAGQEILVSGSSSNNGVYTISTAAAGTLTLQTADALTAESAGSTVVITAMTNPVASDFGRAIDMVDLTNNSILIEDLTRSFSEADPDYSITSSITHYAIQGGQYRFYPTQAATTKIRERYWKVPTALSSDTSTSDLPIETENCLIHWTWYHILEYLNKFDQADRVRVEFTRLLKTAKASNDKVVNKMHMFSGSSYTNPELYPPQNPYPPRWA